MEESPSPGDTSDKRKEIRVPVGLRLFFGLTRPDRLGFVQDLSENGLRIRARKLFDPKTELQMKIEIPGRGLYPLRGVVKRARVIESHMPPYEPAEMGIVIVESNPALKALLQDLLAIHRNRRGKNRREARLRVSLGEVQQLIEEYTHNIGEGGVFVVTDRPPSVGDIVLTTLELPAPWGEIRAECEVAHVVGLEDAASGGRLPGAGLRFTAFAFGDDKKYEEFLTQVFSDAAPEE